MCGICGIISRAWDAPAGPLDAMAAAIRHRGTDASGRFHDSERGVHFAHQRLSIIDLSERGQQPLFNEDRSLVLICNGEFYG
ncbi:MAG: asparagine synthetase B, partial [Verrucomicrobia bacterium]|nr:asparagine synthetase B [Verrucomicrobiota bacterium]